jgi:hypothetical protein
MVAVSAMKMAVLICIVVAEVCEGNAHQHDRQGGARCERRGGGHETSEGARVRIAKGTAVPGSPVANLSGLLAPVTLLTESTVIELELLLKAERRVPPSEQVQVGPDGKRRERADAWTRGRRGGRRGARGDRRSRARTQMITVAEAGKRGPPCPSLPPQAAAQPLPLPQQQAQPQPLPPPQPQPQQQ